jgi:hypothetical protein
LVVSFDDFMWFGTEDDRAALRSFVTERLASWRLNVATLYIVGGLEADVPVVPCLRPLNTRARRRAPPRGARQ